MKTKILKVILGLTLLFSSVHAQAILINIDPLTQTVGVGTPANVDLNISGLTAGGPPTLGGFSLNVNFDDSILDLSSVVFGTQLGVVGLGEAITDVDITTSGVVEVFEVSLLAIAALDALQSDAFTLATLTFDTLAAGNSALSISDIVLSDASGFLLSDIGSEGANIMVKDKAAVPEPTSLMLLGLGLIALVGFTKARNAA